MIRPDRVIVEVEDNDVRKYEKKNYLILDEELEEFRKNSIKEIIEEKDFIKRVCEKTFNTQCDLYIHGSVVDPYRFSRESDIDIAFVINVDGKIGARDDLSGLLQNEFVRIPFNFGIVNVFVFNKVSPEKVKGHYGEVIKV